MACLVRGPVPRAAGSGIFASRGARDEDVAIGELLCILIFLLFALLIVVVVSQQAISGGKKRRAAAQRRRCAFCGHPHGVEGGRCVFCGALSSEVVASDRARRAVGADGERKALRPDDDAVDDKQTILNRLARIHRYGELSDETYERLRSELRDALFPGAAPLAAATPPDRGIVYLEVVDAELIPEERTQGEATPASPGPPPEALSAIPESAPSAEHGTEGVSAAPPLPDAPDSAPAKPWIVEPADLPGASADEAPPRSLADTLSAFMERRNIRWLEVLSGLLIVGCSIGLVISLRATVGQRIPYFTALSFMVTTAIIHFSGLYTLRRWKLKNTSRGVLIVAMLLVPLSFLAAVVLPESNQVRPSLTDPTYLTAAIVGVLGFGLMTVITSRALLLQGWWMLAVVVMGTSVAQLSIGREAGGEMSAERVTALMALPLASYAVALLALLELARRWRLMTRRRAGRVLLIVALGTFSLLAAAALLVSRGESHWLTLAREGPLLALATCLFMTACLVVQRRALGGPRLAAVHTAATSAAVLGGMAMVLLVVLTWLEVGLLLWVAAIAFVALTTMAMTNKLPVLHAPALAALAIAGLVTLHLAQGTITADPDAPASQLWRAIYMGRTAALWTALGGAAVLLGLVLSRVRSEAAQSAGRYYAATGAVLAVIALVLTLAVGFLRAPDYQWATPLLALHAAAMLGMGAIASLRLAAAQSRIDQGDVHDATTEVRRLGLWSWISHAATWIGSVLVLLALVHGLNLNPWLRERLGDVSLLPPRPQLAALVLHAVVAIAVAALWGAIRWRRNQPRLKPAAVDAFTTSLWQSAMATSMLAAHFALWVVDRQYGFHALCWGALAAVWFLASRIEWRVAAFGMFQGAVALALGFVVAEWQWRFGTWDGTLADVAFWQAQVAVALLTCAAWAAARLAAQRFNGVERVMRRPTVDQAILLVAVVGVLALATIGCVPGVLAELGVDTASSSTDVGGGVSSPHVLAYGWQTWLAVSLAAMALAANLLVRSDRRQTVALAIAVAAAAAAVPLLLAAPWETQYAAASALRWAAALYAGVAAAVVCGAPHMAWAIALVRMWSRRGTKRAQVAQRALAIFAGPAIRAGGAASLVLGGVPVAAITLACLAQVAAGNPLGGPGAGSLFDRLGPIASFAVPLLVLASVFVAYAVSRRAPGYMLGGSIVFQTTVTLGCLLRALLADRPLDGVFLAELTQWNALGLGGFSLLWLLLARRVTRRSPVAAVATRTMPFDVPLLDAQAAFTAGASLLIAGWIAWGLLLSPGQMWPSVEQLSGLSSFAALAAATLVAGVRLFHRWPSGAEHDRAATAIVFGFVVAICPVSAAALAAGGALPPWDAVHALTAGWLLAASAACVVLVFFTVRPRETVRMSPADGAADDKPEQSEAQESSTSEIAPAGASRWPVAARATAFWLSLIGALIVVFAVRVCGDDPVVWWSAAMVGALAALFVAAAVGASSSAFAGVSVAMAGLAAHLLWRGAWTFRGLQTFVEWFEMGLLAVLIPAAVLLAANVFRRTRLGTRLLPSAAPQVPVHHLVAGVVAAMLLNFFFLGVVITNGQRLGGGPITQDMSAVGGVVLLALLGLILAGSLWDRDSPLALPSQYAWGLAAVLLVLDQLEDRPLLAALRTDGNRAAQFTWMALASSAAAYVALTGHLWKRGLHLARLGKRLGIPDAVPGLARTSLWLPIVSLVLTGISALVALGSVLALEAPWMRTLAAFAPAVAAYGIGCMARDRYRPAFQPIALLAAGFSLVLLGWADLDPVWRSPLVLSRTIRVLIALALVTFLYTAMPPIAGRIVVLRSLAEGSDWLAAMRRVAAFVAVGAMAVLALVLVQELALFDPDVGAPLAAMEVGAVAVVLVLMTVGLLALALAPVQRSRDGMPATTTDSADAALATDSTAGSSAGSSTASPRSHGLSERERMACVYGAQATAALLFAHLFLSRPMLFFDTLRPYWPYVVMAIAFFGVGAGELFRRYKLRVLGEPFQRAGAFLPLLPALAFWVIASDNSYSFAALGTSYSLVLFVIGLLYVLLCIVRKSFAAAVAAAMAGNAALWALLWEQGFSALVNPQIWLIPPAVSVLVAAQYNRNRLSTGQLTALRYLSILVIYLSSTGEMFITGIGNSIWHPMVLTGLALAGVLLGMALRVRAFLYLGSGFVLLAVVSMVWHSSRALGEVWPWWLFGIGAGLLLMITYGLFERNRKQILDRVRRMQQWER